MYEKAPDAIDAMFETRYSPDVREGVDRLAAELDEYEDGDIDRQWLLRQFGSEGMLQGLRQIQEKTGVSPAAFAYNSYRYDQIMHEDPQVLGRQVEIGASAGNLRQDGSPRREETGPLVDTIYLQQQGVDPSRVILYRGTGKYQGSTKDEPYWTNSLPVANRYLRPDPSNRLILVSTLQDVEQGGGVIVDIEDGAVRRVELQPYDPHRALFAMDKDGIHELPDLAHTPRDRSIGATALDQSTFLLDDTDTDIW